MSCSFLLLIAFSNCLARILYIREAIYFEGNNFTLDVLEEAFCDYWLRMPLLISKLWITILAFDFICFELGLVEVD